MEQVLDAFERDHGIEGPVRERQRPVEIEAHEAEPIHPVEGHGLDVAGPDAEASGRKLTAEYAVATGRVEHASARQPLERGERRSTPADLVLRTREGHVSSSCRGPSVRIGVTSARASRGLARRPQAKARSRAWARSAIRSSASSTPTE